MIEVILKHYVSVSYVSSFVSWAIRKQTRSPYSHVAIWIPAPPYANETSDFKNGIIYEATWPKVRFRPVMAEDSGPNADDFCLQISESDLLPGIIWMQKQLGKKYDLSSVLRFVTRDQAHRKSAEKWFCSEFAFVFSQKISRPLLENCWPWEVAPRDTSHSPIYDRVIIRGERVPEWAQIVRPGKLTRK